MRETLVTALVSCADNSIQPKARRFLAGLSCDELQFIAEFLGACILEPTRSRSCSRAQLAECVAEFQRSRDRAGARSVQDRDHKMIVLLEYLCRCRCGDLPMGRNGRSYAAVS